MGLVNLAFQGKISKLASISILGSILLVTETNAEVGQLIKDVTPDGATNIIELEAVNNKLFFTTDSYPFFGPEELWVTDGSSEGTSIVAPTPAGTGRGAFGLEALNNDLYFGYAGEPHISDGLEFSLIKNVCPDDIRPNSITYCDSVIGYSGNIDWSKTRQMVRSDEFVYFIAQDHRVPGEFAQQELWQTNGTEEGTVKLPEVNPDPDRGSLVLWLNNMLGLQNQSSETLMFIANDGISDAIYRFDPVSGTHIKVHDFALDFPDEILAQRPQYGDPVVSGGIAYFSISIRYEENSLLWWEHELWKTDGTPDGTRHIESFEKTPEYLVAVEDDLYFYVYADLFEDRHIWKVNNGEDEVSIVTDLEGYQKNGIKVFANGHLYFRNGVDLLRYGPNTGLVDLVIEGVVPEELLLIEDTLYVSSVIPYGAIWKVNTLDGSASEILNSQVPSGVGSDGPEKLTNVNGRLFFESSDPIHSRELWVLVDDDYDSAPQKSVLFAPTGIIENENPVFTWQSTPGANSYEFWLNDASGDQFVQVYQDVDVNCERPKVRCSLELADTLPIGTSRWWVRGIGVGGIGQWSEGAGFYLGGIPESVSLVSPSGSLETTSPIFSWNAINTATKYQLFLFDTIVNDRTTVSQWVTSEEASCEGGSGLCSYQFDTALTGDNGTWWVRAASPAGIGDWSDSMSFFTGGVPESPELISPSGVVSATSAPRFIWSSVENAKKYTLWVEVEGEMIATSLISPERAGCTSGSNHCTVELDVDFLVGTGRWWVRAWNGAGAGVWSAPMEFTGAADDVPGSPVILSPTSNEIVDPFFVYVAWEPVQDAVDYEIRIREMDTESVVQQTVVNAAESCFFNTCEWFLDVELNPDSTYLLDMSAANSGGRSDWSNPAVTVIAAPDFLF